MGIWVYHSPLIVKCDRHYHTALINPSSPILVTISCSIVRYLLLSMQLMRCFLLIVGLCFAVEANEATDHPIPTSAAVVVSPVWQAVQLANGQVARISLSILMPSVGNVYAIEGSCGCIRVVSALPMHVDVQHPGVIDLQVVGLAAGVKTIRVLTDHGPATATIDLHIGTEGNGRSMLGQLAERIKGDQRLTPWFIIHDLRGSVRNCGCSAGSLGGIDYLAALPRQWHEISQGRPARFLLTGVIDGDRPTMSAALIDAGWERHPVDVTQGDAAPGSNMALDARLHLWTSSSPPHAQHASDLWIPLDGGAVAAVALMADRGFPDSTWYIPIDRSLDHDEQALRSVIPAQKPVPVVVEEATSCGACHAAAQKAWDASRHAHAWQTLTPAQRQDDCASCHSSPREHTDVREANVTCIGCHQGSTKHAQNPLQSRTTGTTDCRSCHDAKRVPDFDPVAAWLRVQHGK